MLYSLPIMWDLGWNLLRLLVFTNEESTISAMHRIRKPVLVALAVFLLSAISNTQATEPVRIGVLAKRGEEQTLARWQPTADYLSREIPAYHFVLKPLDFEEINTVVAADGVDFVLANPAIYVELESRYEVGRIATMRNRNGHRGYTVFGGVIFTRAGNAAINRIQDLKGKRFAAVKENSFGGYMMAWREMQQMGVAPREDTDLVFLGTHDAVVYAVLNGKVDAGTVRTDTLERMREEGKIDLSQLKVINRQRYDGFSYLCSTRLYPEWPFAKLKHTPDDLSHDVAVALLRLPPDSDVAARALTAGWTVPGNYQSVHDLMRELRIGPYANLGRITFIDLVRNYWYWLLLASLVLLASALVTAYVTRLNLRLRRAEGELIGARDYLAEKVRERTAELEESYRRLERVSRDWNDAFDAISDPIFIHDGDMRIVQANPAYCERAGRALKEMQGQPYYHFFPRMEEPLPSCQHFPEPYQSEGNELQLESGEVFVSRSFGIKRADNTVRHAIHVLEDVTAQRRADREMRRLNRALRTLSRCNTTLVHAEQEQALMDDICRILIDQGGYCFAWVGYADELDARNIQPVAHAGREGGVMENFSGGDENKNPAIFALRHAEAVVVRDLAAREERQFAGWCDAAQRAGFTAAIILPLIVRSEVFGVICIFSDEAEIFDEAELNLLQEMAGDLSFGIHALRNRIKRKQAEMALQQTEERYEELYESAPNAYFSISATDNRVVQFNQALGKLLGYSRADLAGIDGFELYAEGEDGLDKVKRIRDSLSRGVGVRDEELQMRHASGRPVWVSLTVDPVMDAQGRLSECRSMVIDISERKLAEEERTHFAEQLQRSLLQAIRAIALTIEKRDPYTAGHQERVADLAVRVGRELGLAEKELEGIRLGALIHDIGKISIPAEILSRPGKLEPELYSIIKTHPRSGYEIIRGIDFPWPLAEIVLQHHERLDGSGYPQGLKDGEILLAARILIVADVVEAMASHRPYRPALGLESALEEIRRGRDKQYDAAVVDACLKVFEDREEMAAWVDAVRRH
jgi:phosphate/phosphite/phosphonate ABC transporter binding protein